MIAQQFQVIGDRSDPREIEIGSEIPLHHLIHEIQATLHHAPNGGCVPPEIFPNFSSRSFLSARNILSGTSIVGKLDYLVVDKPKHGAERRASASIGVFDY
jgi:hypothetical protein